MRDGAARSRAWLALAALALGCASGGGAPESAPIASEARLRSMAESMGGPASAPREIVRTGDIEVSLDAPEAAAEKVTARIEQAGGYVESSTSNTEEEVVWLRGRVPAESLDAVMDAVAALGHVERRSVSATDVTEQVADLETRLRHDRALVERLQQLLARAQDVEDVLAIEKELNRIQTGIERMQGQLDRIRSQVALSALSIELRRERVLGPLGYLGYGLWWALSKLFVIR